MSQEITSQEVTYKKWVIILSVAIPLAVAMLFGVNLKKLGFDVRPLTMLPPIYATINGLTAVVLSSLFLVLYVAYHMTTDSTTFGGEGIVKYVYLFILITHIILSIIIIPLVLFTYLRARFEKFEAHRKLARITFPLWLYVAVTGVIVYLMISPYYA